MTDYVLDYATVDFKFPSKNLSGVPTAIVGGVFSVYVGNSVTQVTAGLTFTSGFDGITGLNHIRIDLSASASYVAGTDYQVVCTAGTVDSVSVIGEVVREFTIQNTASFAQIGIAGAGLTAAVDLVWDEPLTGGTHNVNTSGGKRLRQITSTIIRSDIAQGSGTGTNQIQLDTGASAINDSYDPSLISIVAGTGEGQSRLILQYNGTSKTATVDRDWKVLPDATSEYVIKGDAGRDHVNEGLVQAGTSTTVTLNALASASNEAYTGQLIFLRSGTGADQAKIVIAYNGTTKVATIDGTWAVIPNTTSGYSMLPSSPVMLNSTTQASIDAILVDTGTTLPARLTGIEGATFATGTDSLESIRNRGDAAWTTGAGGSSPTVEQIRAEMDANSTQLAGIIEDTGTTIPATLAALNDISVADVNAQVLDVLTTDTFAEVTVPAATASIKDMVHYTFSKARNKITQTDTTFTLRNDADNGNLATATVTSDLTTTTKGEDG
jgi:hypothetical protein